MASYMAKRILLRPVKPKILLSSTTKLPSLSTTIPTTSSTTLAFQYNSISTSRLYNLCKRNSTYPCRIQRGYASTAMEQKIEETNLPSLDEKDLV